MRTVLSIELAFVVLLADFDQNCLAFLLSTPPPAAKQGMATLPPPSPFLSTKQESTRKEYRTSLMQTKNEEDEAVLTDLDARVLQDMLRDKDKLDLQDERNMRELLDRGIKAKGKIKDEEKAEDGKEETEFKSEILQKLGSTKLWKAFKRKSEDFVESAKIYVANRIERDAKLVASIGIFAFERAMNDVARALPATSSSRWNPKNQLLLSNVTSAPPQMTEAEKLRQEMSTPLDEIRTVGRQLKDIFRGVAEGPAALEEDGLETDPNGFVSPRATFSRNLNSAAASSKYAVNDKERFQKAYERKQVTKLKREKENVVQASARMANEVVDGAYQIRREVQAETNEPGYKTKVIRGQTADASRQLAAGARRILGGAKSLAVAALAASRKREDAFNFVLPENADGVPEAGGLGLPEMEQTMVQPDAPLSLKRLEMLDELETEMERILDLLTKYISSPQETWLDPDLLLQSDGTMDQEFNSFSNQELESVVVAMVQAQALLEQPMSNEDEWAMISTLELVLPTIEEICDTSVRVGSPMIAEYFEKNLIYGGVKDGETPLVLRLNDLLSRLESLKGEPKMQQDIEASMNAAVEPTMAQADDMPWFAQDNTSDEVVQETRPWFMEDDGVDDGPVVEAVPVGGMDSANTGGGFRMPWQRKPQESGDDYVQVVEVPSDTQTVFGETSRVVDDVEILDAFPTVGGRAEATVVENDWTYNQQDVVEDRGINDDYADSMRSVSAEVVSDDDFDVAMGQAKVADEVGEDDREEDEEINPAAMFALRSLDVVLLAGEKTAAVLPSLINIGNTASERLSNAKSDGLGSEGWEIISSAQRGDRKY